MPDLTRSALQLKISRPFGLLAFAGAVAATADAQASEGPDARYQLIEAQLVEDIGAAERIEAADILRTLTQEVSSASCYLFSGVDMDESRRLMIEARDKFDKNFDALLNGNASMNIIGGETRRKTIAKLERIGDLWLPMSEAVTALVADPRDAAAVKVIKTNNVPLFDLTDYLVSEISGEYSNPAELMQVDAIMLDIVGRQGMLTQKIAKNACKVWNGEQVALSTDALSRSMQTFEVSLNALMHGMPEAGVKPAPTPHIRSTLEGVVSDWGQTRPLVDELLASGDLAGEAQVSLFRRMNDKMYRLEALAHDYALYSKHSFD
jgi:hypothetical protein